MRIRQGKGPQLRLLKAADMPRQPKEKVLEKAIRDGLQAIGIPHFSGKVAVWKDGITMYVPVFGKGTPDLLGFWPGMRMFGIENKRPGEKLNPDQEKWHAWFRSLGGRIYVATDAGEAIRWADANRRLGA